MQITKSTPLHVVAKDGELCGSNIERIVNMVKGGLSLDEIQIFTTQEEADLALSANIRRAHIDEFSDHAILNSAKLVLVDQNGQKIDEVEFPLSDHYRRG